MKSRKTFILLVSVIVVVILFFGVISLINNSEKQKEDTVNNDTDMLEEKNAEDKIEHNLQLSIISPEESIIYSAQARMYEALVEGNGKYSKMVKCNWKFYLNENNEEVLYREQDNTGILSGESKKLCAFTSKFIDRVGKLKVVLTMTVYDAANPNIETITAQREYTVSK